MAWNLTTGAVVGVLVAGLARVATGRDHVLDPGPGPKARAGPLR